jgi:prepilin-type N-terminal cleavage/methylation domain-containing protein
MMNKIVENDGFTVLEVMIAVIILTLSLLLLLNMSMVALDGNDWSNRATMSTQLLQEKLEELRTAADFLNTGIDTVDNIQRSWTVTNTANHLRRVDITASWRNRRGDLLSNNMTAYIRTDSI